MFDSPVPADRYSVPVGEDDGIEMVDSDNGEGIEVSDEELDGELEGDSGEELGEELEEEEAEVWGEELGEEPDGYLEYNQPTDDADDEMDPRSPSPQEYTRRTSFRQEKARQYLEGEWGDGR